jgi:hypothetical protein
MKYRMTGNTDSNGTIENKLILMVHFGALVPTESGIQYVQSLHSSVLVEVFNWDISISQLFEAIILMQCLMIKFGQK